VFAAISIYADVSEIRTRLGGFGWWAFGAALALALVNYLVRLLRWWLYLGARDIRTTRAIGSLTFFAGFALSITPGKLGELIKSYLLRESSGVPITRSAPIVVAERVSDLIALLILGLAGVAVYGVARNMVIGGAAIIAAGLLVLSWPMLARSVILLVCKPRFMSRFAGKLLAFYEGLAELIRPWPLTWSTALGVVAWLAECLGFALIVSAFPGTDVPVGLATLIYAVTTVAGALSFLPGGLLVTEAAMTLLLVQASRGVDQPTAVAATILTRLATLWFAVLLGLVAMAALRRLVPASANALNAATEDDEPGPPSNSDQAGTGAAQSSAILSSHDSD
jgi:uncharacterized protein (TIRG00374 family)